VPYYVHKQGKAMANKFAFGLVLSGLVAAAGVGIAQQIQNEIRLSNRSSAPEVAEEVAPSVTATEIPLDATETETQGVSHAETLRMADEAALKRIAKQINGTPTWEGPAFDAINDKYQ
jgi:hypothetical protein